MSVISCQLGPRMNEQDLETIARTIFREALAACDVRHAFAREVAVSDGQLRVSGANVDLTRYREVRVVAIGKAANAMLASFANVLDLGPPIAKTGLAIAHTQDDLPIPEWARTLVGDHPIPGSLSFEAGREVLNFVDGCTSETLAVFLLSGGGSALAEWPLVATVSPPDLSRLNTLLVRSELPIRAINAVRKHLSALKAGRLALRAAPADQLTLVVSDVAPGDFQSVASGPTVPDETTVHDVARALDEANLRERLPEALRQALSRESIAETPKTRDFAGLRSWVATLLDSSVAAHAAVEAASSFGASIASLDTMDGLLGDVVDSHLRALEHLVRDTEPGQLCAVVSAGEVTLDVTGDGLGGRNQHAALYALSRVRELCPSVGDFAILSAGTDGRDGPTDAAGACGSTRIVGEASDRGLDMNEFLRTDDSYHFFEPLSGLVVTGPTGTNVRDVRVFLGRRPDRWFRRIVI
jgi:glycerate 2-kinase